MTSANIVGMNPYFTNNMGNNSKTPEIGNSDSFSQIFEKTNQFSDGDASKVDSVGSKKQEDTVSVKERADVSKKTSLEPSKMEEATVDEEDVEKTVGEAVSMLVQKTAEIFQVSVEEVEQVLEDLGLTPLDLLNMENLPKIAIAFHPEADALTMMTDENLFGDFKMLMNTVQDTLTQLEAEFSLTPEDFEQLINSMQESYQMQEGLAQPMEMEPFELSNQMEIPDNISTSEEAMEIPVSVEVKKDASQGELSVKQEQSLAESLTESVHKKESQLQRTQGTSENFRENNRGDQKEGMTETSFSQTVVNSLADAVEETTVTTSYSTVDGRSIMEQITDYIKVNVSPDTTEMELQLHPASLGAVKVQVASAGGVLTATFTTQNEAVKAALETQLIQLKENFEQQGLKVESIEVNVSAQGFERSLEGEQGREQFEQQRQKGNRRIRLQGLGGTEEELTEDLLPEDQVIADMMIRNGNTVDYTV